jgi:hypothetical protein
MRTLLAQHNMASLLCVTLCINLWSSHKHPTWHWNPYYLFQPLANCSANNSHNISPPTFANSTNDNCSCLHNAVYCLLVWDLCWCTCSMCTNASHVMPTCKCWIVRLHLYVLPWLNTWNYFSWTSHLTYQFITIFFNSLFILWSCLCIDYCFQIITLSTYTKAPSNFRYFNN